MKYYKLMYDYKKSNNYIDCIIENVNNIDEYVVSSGVLVDNLNSIEFKYNLTLGNMMADYISNTYRWLIVSDIFSSLLKQVVSSDFINNIFIGYVIIDFYGSCFFYNFLII